VGCGGSVGEVVAQFGDVVAQLAQATETEDAAVPGSNPAPPQSPERIFDCVSYKNKNLSK
jgi:hypothetical protein